VLERRLEWEALRNARDLGGLPLDGGGETRAGVLVRSDTLRQLTSVGWADLEAYGVRTVLDLRFQVEIDADEPVDTGPGGLSRELLSAHADRAAGPRHLRKVCVSILGEPDTELGRHFDALSRAEADEATSTRAVYLEMLALFRPRFVQAVSAIAEADAGGVLVHCHAGKDRTGLVVALVLGALGVDPGTIAADYAFSGPNLASSLAAWIGDADDPDEREHRRRVALSPEQAMLDVLEAIDDVYGGPVHYLRDGGLRERDLERIRERLAS